MSVVPFLAEDVEAVEAGRRACHAAGDTDNAAALSWLASRMRVEQHLDIEAEAHAMILESRVAQYGRGPQLRAVEKEPA